MADTVLRKLRRLLARPAAPEQPAPRFDADGWERQRRTVTVDPGPFRGLSEPDPVFGWRREH